MLDDYNNSKDMGQLWYWLNLRALMVESDMQDCLKVVGGD